MCNKDLHCTESLGELRYPLLLFWCLLIMMIILDSDGDDKEVSYSFISYQIITYKIVYKGNGSEYSGEYSGVY